MKGDKHWPNTWTEVEDLGGGKFGASLSVGHRVFFDKADGNKPKKHKLTDERSTKDYVLIQSAKCCVEVYPYYAKYYDVQHEEVRLYEERWVVQRLFKAPDTWRDVDAYNPFITVEEYPEPAGDVVKVTVTYDTDYGVLTVEYFQRDGNSLKHNITFKNASGSTEIFRVLQRWAGIVGAKCNGKDIPTNTNTPFLAFHKADKPAKEFTIAENANGVMRAGLQDILEMLTGDREPVTGERALVEKDGIKLTVEGYRAHLWIDGKEVMTSIEGEHSSMVRAVEDCPDNARVFVGGLGLGVVLLSLFLSDKAAEVIVCEKDQRVIDNIAPLVQEYFGSRLNLQIIQGDAAVEVSNHGKFDWIFMDFFFEMSEADQEWLRNLSTPNLTVGGVYTSYSQPELRREARVPYFQSVEVGTHPNGMKADFIYSRWLLAHNESLEIDPATATLNDPTVDGEIFKDISEPTYTRYGAAAAIHFAQWDRASAGDLSRGYAEWDISSIDDAATITKVEFRYEGEYHAGNCDIRAMANQPSVQSDDNAGNQVIFDDCADGTAYLSNDAVFPAAGVTKDVGGASGPAWDTDPKSDVQSALVDDWFALGFKSTPEDEMTATANGFYSEDKTDAADPKPTLYVEYSTGWSGKISGVTNPAKVMGVDVANIAKVKGVA